MTYLKKDLRQSRVSFEKTMNTSIKQRELVGKYAQKYDIVTLEALNNDRMKEDAQGGRQKMIPKSQVNYNILTNELLPDSYKIPSTKIKEKKLLGKNKREFNIVSNNYLQNNEEKLMEDEKANTDIASKRMNNRKFNIVTASLYNNDQEEEYQNKLAQTNKDWGSDFKKRFPPSWKFRENLVIDPTKEVPEEVLLVQHRKEESKKRYKVRHYLEKEYKVVSIIYKGKRLSYSRYERRKKTKKNKF